MTDNEIVKALECCADEMGCKKGCPFFDPKSKSSHCAVVGYNGLEKLALDLINRQKEEIEQWQGGYMTQKQEIANLEIELKAMRGAANSYKAEIERLKKGWKADVILTANVKSEAHREFAERLDKEFSGVGTCNYGCVHHKTRKVLKELVGEDDA